MPKLRWLQGTNAGTAMMLTPPVRERRIRTTSGRGLHSVPFAELTVAYIFAMAKHIPEAVMAQREHRWAEDLPYTVEVQGKTLGLVGFGEIGSEIAKKTHGLGLRIIATRLHDYVPWPRNRGSGGLRSVISSTSDDRTRGSSFGGLRTRRITAVNRPRYCGCSTMISTALTDPRPTRVVSCEITRR